MPPKAKPPRSEPAPSASPGSASSPPRLAGTSRDLSSTSLGSLPQIEVKPQKACVLCRRSKVKCIHDGAPPCKRCRDTHQEAQCKFRLRADDETWRERTDEVLSRLGDSVDWLVQHQRQQQQLLQQQQQHIVRDRSDTTASSASSMSAPSPRKPHRSTLYRPAPPPPPGRGPSASGWHAHPHPPALQGDHIPSPSDPAMQNNGQAPHDRPSFTTYLGFDGAAGLLSPGNSHARSASSPSSSTAAASRHHRAHSTSQTFRPLHNPHPPPSFLPSPAHQPQLMETKPFSASVSASHLAASHHVPAPGPTAIPGPAQSSPVRHPQQASALEPGQSRPSPILYAAQRPLSNTPQSSRLRSRSAAAKAISPYARPSHFIGRNDPRLTVISMGLISMDQARHLFKFFARYLQPHCFGFPAYPANEHMTPLIIACILMVSSIHEPNTRHFFERFRHEAFSSPLLLDQPIDPLAPLDPELGIGVEEITGACIAACWLGGQTALSIARLARYWAIAYLEHFEVRSAQTLGEWMTILPPFRQIDLVGKLRIWLMSYITEAQQAVINDQPSLFPESQPAHYCQGLLNASSHSGELSETFANEEGGIKTSESINTMDGTPKSNHSQSSAVPPLPNDGTGGIGSFTSDRQLVAHARMMSILLAAQDLARSARAAATPVKPTSTDPASSLHAQEQRAFEPSHMVERWREWLEELNRWRLLTSQHSDLSDNSLESIDLSLLYHLSRTFLASHPLEPELGILDETQQALRAASNANPPDFSRLAVAQLRTISTAKHSALFALKLATTEFGEKLSYLPQFYHWLLGHAAGLLLLLVQRREVFLMAKEAESLLEVTEKFVQLYVFRIASHSLHSATGDNGLSSSMQRNERERVGIKRSASDAELGEGNLDNERRKHQSGPGADGSSDPLDFQWPFMSGFPTSTHAQNGSSAATAGNGAQSSASSAGAATMSTSPNPISQQQLNHGNPAEKHPALANAQALARTLYLVKMQVQSLDVQL
ncbi:hypothetical protein EX895_006303 [Sporisorium graminicola]|uniref:Zn(2)-C6 fungal-type domain-containing protein n=1 Tax=Sporisorium graminicola TaxID=280036 RepID=A0A4U7KMD8_9BASI|nr:hypothetical protein EX895_006303 [Sporisorium graminicola]TKY85223.1 hypothetical protein EX895_006303 [Sporisorium graminicola]